MIKTFFKKNWLILLILSIAAFCRLYKIGDYMEFLGDQGRDVVIVWNFLKNGDLFFIGPQTSMGNMYLGPFYYYLFVAPGLLFSSFNPIGPSIIVALLGVLTVYFIYRFTKTWFSIPVAYTAAFLYAISPVVIKYSSFSWNPNVMPLFALLFIYFVSQSCYIYASIMFIICLNSHYLAVLLLPVAGIIWLFQIKNPKLDQKSLIRKTMVAVFIFLLSLIPQFLFDYKHDGQNIKAFVSFFTQSVGSDTTIFSSTTHLLSNIQIICTRLLAGKNVFFGPIITLIFLGLLFLNLYHQFKAKKYNTPFNTLTLWLFVGLFGLIFINQHLNDHYFAFLFPVVFILFSYLVYQLPRYLTITIIILVTLLSLLENSFRWSPPRQLATTIQVDQSIISAANNRPFNFALLAKTNYDPGYRYFFTKENQPVELLQNKITDQLFVVCESTVEDCQPINNPEWNVAAFGWAKIDTQWEINGIKIFRLIHNVAEKP